MMSVEHPSLGGRSAPPGTARRARARAIPGWALPAILAFLSVDYGRPQDLIRPLALLRPALLLTLLLAYLLFQRTERVHWRHPAVYAYGALLVFMALWVPLATNNYWALVIFQSMAQWLVFVLAVVGFVDTQSRMRALVTTWLMTGLVQVAWVMTHNGHGLGGFFGDENDVCLFLNMMIPFGLAAARTTPKGNRRLMYYAMIGVFVGGVVITRSRGGFVGLIAVLGAMMLLSRQRVRLMALSVVGLVLFMVLVPSSYTAEMRTMTNPKDETRVARLEMWRNARAVWRSNPFLGVGQGNVSWVVSKYESYDHFKAHSYAGRAVHSAYFTVLADLGLLGIALYLVLIGQMSSIALRNSVLARRTPGVFVDAWSRALLQALAAYLACSLFISTLYYPHLYYMLALALCLERHHTLVAQRRSAAPAPAPGRGAPALREPGPQLPG